MSADTRTVHERMVAILADLPPIGKEQKNVQQNFMFRGHDDVLNALNPLLAKHGVFCVPHVLGRETSQRTTAKGTAMYEVSLLVEFTFYGPAGDFVRGSTWGEGTDMGDKATSKAMTMAFKSMLNQAFAISNKETADPDRDTAEHTTGRTTTPTHPAPATAAQLAEYRALAEAWGLIHPDFDVPAALTLAEGKASDWVERATAKLKTNIEERAAKDAAPENKTGFEIPLSPADRKKAAA